METRRLTYFLRIADEGSLTRAAEFLRIAQPALSRQMRLLEEELGVTLFQRTARGMQLTEEGEYLRGSVAGPLRAIALAMQNVRSFSARIEGDFTLGMPSGLSELLAAPLALRMDDDFPNVRLRIVEGVHGSLIDWLNRGIVDFALLEELSLDDRLAQRELFSERLVLVGSADSGLKPRRAKALADVVELPLVLSSHHMGLRGLLNDAMSKRKLTPSIRFEAGTCRLIKELVEAGRGFAILPRSYFCREYRERRLAYCAIAEPDLNLVAYIAYRRNQQVTTGGVEAKVIEAIVRRVRELQAGSVRR
jgi:DNA-binding transcriptional LysR family regulator